MALVALVLGWILLGSAGSSSAQFLPHAPVGPEFGVNTYTTGFQGFPRVAALGSGDFVVVWQSEAQDGSLAGIFGQRLDPDGVKLGPEFQVNTYTTSQQFDPALAADGAGNFVVVWESSGQDGSLGGIFGQRYDGGGAALGTEFAVNTYTTSTQDQPAVGANGAGDFVVAWRSGQDGHVDGVFGRVFNSSGSPLGPDFQVNTYTTSDQRAPAVAGDGAGNFVVVWDSSGQDGSGAGIFGQRYDSSGGTLGSEFPVNTYTTGPQQNASVAADGAGNFLVVWESVQDGSPFGIIGLLHDSNGAPLGTEFQVNTYTTDSQSFEAVAADGSGNFITVWSSNTQDGSSTGVFGQRFDGGGAPLGSEFRVNTYTTGDQTLPAVAADSSGSFIVVWQSDGQDGSFNGIFAQRFALGRLIRGKKLLVRNPGAESQRTVVAVAKETATDIGSAIIGDPVAAGATLRIITKGTTNSDQTYVLDGSGWAQAGTTGFKYTGPTGGDGDPVQKVILKRTSSGKALLRATLKGSIGTQSLDVVPPNLGDEAGLILTINGGATYCVSFGGAAGGEETGDSDVLWKIVNPTAEPGCPTPL